MVTIELIDFTSHTSSDHDDSNNNIQYLFNLLKKTIRKHRFKAFSLNFEMVGALEKSTDQQNYDIIISEKHNILIATQGTCLLFYNRITSTLPPISDKILFKVDINIVLKCLKLNEEKDGDYLYVSTVENTILKINLTQLLRTKEQSIIWTSEKFAKLWGIDALNDKVYGVSYNTGIIVLDSESGKTLTNSTLPKLTDGYQIIFISSTEMIISHNHCVELFQLTNNHWKSMKKTVVRIETAYSMFYERDSKLIYLSDSLGKAGEQIKVINGKDFSLVKAVGNFNMNFGMCIDRLSGLLYVCDAYDYIIKVFQ